MTVKRPTKADQLVQSLYGIHGNQWFLPTGTREAMHSLWARGEIDRRTCPTDQRYFEYRIRPIEKQEEQNAQELDD